MDYVSRAGVRTTTCHTGTSLVVLLVDDDHNDMALFALAVEQTDTPIWVQTALGVRQAIAYLEGQDKFADRNLHPFPDLLLLDLKMHMGDGFEFLEWRQRSNRFASLPVVVFSGNQYQADIHRAVQLGASSHINKPMSFKELKDTVRKVLEFGLSLQHLHC